MTIWYTPRQRGKVFPEVLFDFVEGAVKVRGPDGEWMVALDDYVLRPVDLQDDDPERTE